MLHRTARTQPITTATEKISHWMAYDRWGPSDNSGRATGDKSGSSTGSDTSAAIQMSRTSPSI